MKTPRDRRGQNMVLLALLMLFAALMVTMTLSLAIRVKQRHELQTLADAAAYSNAVMTARAYNNAALVNRLEVSYFVASAANQAAISWGTYGRAIFGAARAASKKAATECNALSDEADELSKALQSKEEEYFEKDWDAFDVPAALETAALQGQIGALRDELLTLNGGTAPPQLPLRERLVEALRAQTQVQATLEAAGVNDITAFDGAGAASAAHVDCRQGPSGLCEHPSTALDPDGAGSWSQDMLEASMGSRGKKFVGVRGGVPTVATAVMSKLLQNYPWAEVKSEAAVGDSMWGDGANGTGHTSVARIDLIAHDHGQVSVTLSNRGGGCKETVSVNATTFVRTTDRQTTTDTHTWNDGVDDHANELQHTMGTCASGCPSVWVRTLGFMPDDETTAWGQPKNIVALERDNARNPLPWDLHFAFHFGNQTSQFDQRGLTVKQGAIDIGRPVALATGMAYYHRAGHFDEFPNLLNPFWRATLVPFDIDGAARANGDLHRALSGAGNSVSSDVYQALLQSGFKGLH
jgi:hypothetical protein